MSTTSVQPPAGKPAINIQADISILNRLMCCNTDFSKGAADTPTTTSKKFFAPDSVPTEENVSRLFQGDD